MIYRAGDPVPREWFSKLENVVSATFHCDCEESVTAGQRTVRRIGNGPYMVRFEGEHMTIEAAMPTFWQFVINVQANLAAEDRDDE